MRLVGESQEIYKRVELNVLDLINLTIYFNSFSFNLLFSLCLLTVVYGVNGASGNPISSDILTNSHLLSFCLSLLESGGAANCAFIFTCGHTFTTCVDDAL